MNEGMEIEVYHHSDPLTKVNTLNAAKEHEFLEELKSTGGGSFKINALDPKILANPDLLAGRNVFKLRVDGEVVSAFIREKRKKRIISSGERKDQDHTISGPGLKAWFDDAEVRPYAGLKTRSQDTRYFNFASEQGPWYISADWVTPTVIGTIFEPPYGTGRPEKWPEETPAKWVWGSAYSSSMPLGNCYFRYEFTSVGNSTYVLYTAADDNFTLYIDGEKRVETDPATSALYETVRTEFTLSAGPHVIAYRAANGTLDGVTPRGPAAFVAALFKIESDKEVLVTKTGDTGWTVNAYPAEEPGWTAASVLLTLMAEAEARGVRFPTWLNPTFTHTLDSYGLPWTDKMPWSFKVGESLLSVLSSIEELIGDIWIDPDNYDMNFVPQRSFDRSAIIRYEDGSTREAVMFTKGKNLIEADSEGRSKLKNALSVKTDLGWLGVDDDSGSIATYGRLEGTLKVGAPRALSQALADVVISQKRNEEEGATYVILPTELETPFVKFNVGDYVAAPNEANESVSRRVLSIAVKQSSTGQPEYSVEFDVIFRENEERVNRILNKIGAGGVGGGYNGVTNPPTSFGNPVVIPPPPTPPTLFPLAPTGLVVTSEGNWTPDGVTAYSQVTLDWDPVTSNTDGSVTTPEYYEIWGHSTDETDDVYQPFGRTTDTLITIKPFNPGSSWTFKVLARNPSGEASAFSSEVPHTPVGPTAQMTAPSTPVVTSDKGNLIITWDGLLGGVAPPPQFRYVYAKVATTAGGSYTQRGQTLGRGGGNIVVSGLTVGQAYHVKLVAVDGANISSPDSLSASTTLTGISLGSLEADVEAAITAAQEAADAAQIDADSAFLEAVEAQELAEGIISRGNDLVRNGNGKEPLEENWSTWTSRHPEDAPTGTFASFEPPTSQSTNYLDDIIPIDPSKSYLASAWVRQTNLGVTSRFYYGISPIDAAGLGISPNFYMERVGTRTTLAAALNPGDTVVQLTSGAGWNNANDAAPFRSFIFWNYVDSFGKAWPAGTYSRNFYSGAWNAGGVSGNTITLAAPWSGPAIAAGTEVSNGASGGTFMYPISNAAVPSSGEWTKYVGTSIGGIHTDNTVSATSSFPIATASVKIVMLRNYSAAGGTSKQRFAGISLSDVDAARAVATSALDTANGKNKIVFSTSAASGTDYSTGDIWFQKSGSTIVGQWEFVSGAWASRTLTNAVISTLDAGKITTGTLAAARIAAGTITAEKLAIGDASNMAEIGANPAGNTVIVSGVTHDAPGPAGGWFQRSATTGQTHLFRNQKGPLPFKTGDRIRITFDAYASIIDNVQLSLYVYGNASLVQTLSVAFDLDTVADTYTFETDITVDTIGKTSFTLGLSSIAAGTQTYLRNVRVYRMNAGELVVDGSIIADKLAAGSVVAGKVAALAIAAENIQARTITAAQIASETLTAEEILARSISADRMVLGTLTVNELHPDVGRDLNISANEAVNILVGQITAVESDVVDVGDTVETLQTYYKFTAQGALIESPGSPYSIGIKSDRIQMLQNGVEVSYWNAGVMYVNSFVGESVILGNHQIVKSGTGTIVRKL